MVRVRVWVRVPMHDAPGGAVRTGQGSKLSTAPTLPVGAAPVNALRSNRATVAQAGFARLLDTASAYLPLLLMALLALGTWWLVKNTPLFDLPARAAPPRHEPDYTMAHFKVQRFAPDGPMRVQIEGDLLRHYPDTNTIEIDNPRIQALAPDGRVTVATAQHAVSNGDASEIQLSGGAYVVRESAADLVGGSAGDVAGAAPIEFRSEFLHYFVSTEQIRSHLPVTLTQGPSQLRADGFSFDNLTRGVELKGRVHAVFAMPGAASAPTAPVTRDHPRRPVSRVEPSAPGRAGRE